MIGIVGASGLIGYNFHKTLKSRGEDVIGTYFSAEKKELIRFDLKRDSFSLFDKCKQVVITSAITNVDECFLNKDEAYELNVERTIEFIKYLSDTKIKPIFLSSDQVFDGEKGNYTEEDRPNPINHYGNFKLQVEEFMKNNLEDYLILRLSKTYSKNLKEHGMFAEIFSRLKRDEKVKAAYNQIFNPTDIRIVCDGMYKAINVNLNNLYHLANHMIMSRYDFVLSVADEYGFDKNLIESIDIRDLPLAEQRPLNTSLNVKKISEAIGELYKLALNIS
jgi:dTDP-4-dehydrorhamnose reductase